MHVDLAAVNQRRVALAEQQSDAICERALVSGSSWLGRGRLQGLSG